MIDHRLPPIGTIIEFEGHQAEVVQHHQNAIRSLFTIEYLEPRVLPLDANFIRVLPVNRATIPLDLYLGESIYTRSAITQMGEFTHGP